MKRVEQVETWKSSVYKNIILGFALSQTSSLHHVESMQGEDI